MKKRKNRAGFTLAELLIVIAILAILVAIAVPVFTANRNKAGLATDHANMRTLKTYAMTLASTGTLDAGGQNLDVSKAAYSVYCFMADGRLKWVADATGITGLPPKDQQALLDKMNNPPTPEGAYLAQGSEDECELTVGAYGSNMSKSHKAGAGLFLFIS